MLREVLLYMEIFINVLSQTTNSEVSRLPLHGSTSLNFEI